MNILFPYQEADLDYKRMKLCNYVHILSLWPGTVSRLLKEEVLLYFPEFNVNGKAIVLKPMFRQIVDKHWVKFCRDALDYIWKYGILVFRLSKIENGVTIPRVVEGIPGEHYRITTWFDTRKGEQRFNYYKMYSKTSVTSLRGKIDKKISILNTFGFSPTLDGKITSIVSNILQKEAFYNLEEKYYLRAEYNRSNPMLILETDKDAPGVVRPEDLYGFYGDLDPSMTVNERRYVKNRAETEEVINHSREFFKQSVQECKEKMGSLANCQSDNIDIFKSQPADNMMPLPYGHHLVNQQLPSVPTSWEKTNQIYIEQIFSAYGLSRQTMITESSSRTLGSAELANREFNRIVNSWRITLGEVLSQIYCKLYSLEDCIDTMIESDLKTTDVIKMTEDEIKNLMNINPVSVVFPNNPSITPEEMFTQWALGLMSFDKLRKLIWHYNGFNITDLENPNDTQDPWDLETKISILKNSSAKKFLSRIGNVKNLLDGETTAEKKTKSRKNGGTNTENSEKEEKGNSKKEKGTDNNKKEKRGEEGEKGEEGEVEEPPKKKKKKNAETKEKQKKKKE